MEDDSEHKFYFRSKGPRLYTHELAWDDKINNAIDAINILYDIKLDGVGPVDNRPSYN